MTLPLPQVIFLALAVAGVVVVILTRLRLRRRGTHSGPVALAPWIVDLHTVLGLGGYVPWVLWLLGKGPDWLKWPALVMLWAAVLVSFAFVGRWSRKGARHRAPAPAGDWTSTPFLSRLAHYAFALVVLAATVCLATGVMHR